MADLLNTVNERINGQSAKEGEKSSTSSLSGQSAGGETLVGAEATTAGVTAGDDLIDVVSPEEGAAQDKGTLDNKSSETKAEVSDEKSGVQSSGTWTKESALLEVKRLREENKLRRLREKEIAAEYDNKFNKFKEELQSKMETALKAKEELEALKSKEEDKKRSMEEKLAHREAVIAEAQAQMEALKADYERTLSQKEEMLKELQAQQEAQLAVYRSRIEEEIASIPESKRKFAEMITKGYKDGSYDPREAWTALAEARAEGVFEDKQVVVSHATPGPDAARMTQEKLEAAVSRQKAGMKSGQMIAAGLKEVQNRRGKIL